MDFDDYGNPVNTYNRIWRNEESAGPENDDFSDYIFNEQGSARGRGGYGPNDGYFFNDRNSFQPPRPRFFWGRGYGPTGPPKHQFKPPRISFRENETVSFLLRCGVIKETVIGLPKTLLRLMKPKSCGICAQEFDKFDGARLHYISKNHIRNQKKWLTQQAKIGSQRPKEIPLKGRDLYCELCDVHITSTIHATSHYAGRPHRAIVEGRKLPKNPFLLQNNMKERVQQLIRREKRNLKPIKEPESSQEEKAEILTILPELFCDICKIAVTCTEQMTMHLNGKKHLLKEKRHILYVMQGEETTLNSTETADTDKDGNAEGADANAQGSDADAQGSDADAQGSDANAQGSDANAQGPDADAQDSDANAQGSDANAQSADAQEKGQTSNNEDESDWGHGTGNWDDPQ